MLRRMDGWGLTGFHGMDWDAAAALIRKLLEWGALAGTVFLLCRITTSVAVSPFAMAFLAAALLAGRNAAAALAGCMAGAAGGSLRDFNLALPIGAAVVLAGSIAWDLLSPRLEAGEAPALLRRLRRGWNRLRPRAAQSPAPKRQARSPNRWASTVCGALAGLGVLLPGLGALGEALWPGALTVAAASVASVAASPFILAALEAPLGRRWRSPESRGGWWLLMGLLAAGLARFSPPVALCVGGAMAQVLYPGGALAGVAVGGALLAVGVDARALALTAAGGATAQLCAGLSRPARAACACGATLAVGLMLNAPTGLLLGAGASSLLVAPMPGDWARALARLAEPTPDPCDPHRLAERLRRDSASRLKALGAAFGELAACYRAPEPLPDEQVLIQRLRRRLCEGCGGYAACWGGGREGGARLLCDLVARAVALSGESPLFEGEAPPELARRCRRGRLIPERIGEPLEDFARARREGLKRGSENRLISAQFSQARRLIDGLAVRQSRPLRLRERQAIRAAAALERAGIETTSVMALGGRSAQIVATLKEGKWTPERARLAATRLARTFSSPFAVSKPRGRELRLVRRPRLRAQTGVACASRVAGEPCGDSHLVCMLDDERLLMLICDGMGSGEAARRESAAAVRLLGRFLRAGAACALAIETVNALLLNRSGEEMFATMDLLIVNLNTGGAELVKLAACPTLIARNGQTLRVEGGRLPLGILEKVRPGVHRLKLLPGDTLLMATDGVMDAAGIGALEALMVSESDMSALSRRALAAAEAAGDPDRRDDMTAMCLRVEGRQLPGGSF